jgi:hypothetical protein
MKHTKYLNSNTGRSDWDIHHRILALLRAYYRLYDEDSREESRKILCLLLKKGPAGATRTEISRVLGNRRQA